MRPRSAPSEPLVLDGFRTFEHSQYWPMDLNLLVETSHFVYGFSDSELRRSGTMRPSQLVKRSILETKYGRPNPRAMRNLRNRSFVHERTSSRAARTTKNPLFPANLADMLLRHSSANHKRETIAFSKRRQGVLYRAAAWVVWRNSLKDRSENRRIGPPAKALGLVQMAMTVAEILGDRLFPDRVGISGWLSACDFGRIRTRALQNGVSHQASYAI